jgi:hypothetical protein
MNRPRNRAISSSAGLVPRCKAPAQASAWGPVSEGEFNAAISGALGLAGAAFSDLSPGPILPPSSRDLTPQPQPAPVTNNYHFNGPYQPNQFVANGVGNPQQMKEQHNAMEGRAYGYSAGLPTSGM